MINDLCKVMTIFLKHKLFLLVLQEMSQFLEGNGDSQTNLETYKSLLHENQEFLINKTKENQEFLTRNSDNPGNFFNFIGKNR